MTDKRKWKDTTRILKEGSIPCFDFAESAAKALASLVQYQKIRSAPKGSIPVFSNIDSGKVKLLIDQAKAGKKALLNATDVYTVLECYGIPVPGWAVVNTVEDAVIEANKLDYPVVVKADSEQISHKSDLGGVMLNISSDEELKDAVTKMKNSFQVDDLKFFIQQQKPKGKELIVGAKKEEGLGHLIMFGLGGVFVEVFKDVVFNIAPLTDKEAESMPESIKASVLLDDFRGTKGVDKTKITDIILRLSQLVTDNPDIKEFDINPVLATPGEVCAVDARIIL
jgi:acetyltransferase